MPASLKPETGGGAEVQWAKLEFSNGLNDVEEAVVFSCRFRLIGSEGTLKAAEKEPQNEFKSVCRQRW